MGDDALKATYEPRSDLNDVFANDFIESAPTSNPRA